MRKPRLSRLVLAAVSTLALLSRVTLAQDVRQSAASQPAPMLHLDHVTAADMNAAVDHAIAEARDALERIIVTPGLRTVENALRVSRSVACASRPLQGNVVVCRTLIRVEILLDNSHAGQ